MILTNIVEIIHRQATHLTLYHEACYRHIAWPSDIVMHLLSVPNTWIDPGCAFCRRALATYPVNEQMERDFLRTVDECEREVVS